MRFLRRPGLRPLGQAEFGQRLGDMPDDLGTRTREPSPLVQGYDTTGTRLSQPGAAQQISRTLQSWTTDPLLNPFYDTILEAFRVMQRKSHFATLAFTASSAAVIQVRPQEERTYFLIQNNSAAVIYLGIGYAPTAVTGIQLPAGAVFEPFQVPDNEIFILGSAASQNGVILYANG